MRDRVFLDVIRQLESGTRKRGGDKPITVRELEILHGTIEDIYDNWSAGNFVKLCAHLEKPTMHYAARAILDLADNHWFYERTIEESKKRKTHKIQPARRRWNYMSDDFDYVRSSPASEMVQRYKEYDAKADSPDMRAFLSQHFYALTERQRNSLSDLRPKAADGALALT